MVNHYICKQCEDVYNKFNQKVEQISNDTKITLPKPGYYYYGLVDCWYCNKEILVFAWDKFDEWDDKDKPSELPIPSTIKLMHSKTANSEYWANTCHYCDAIQGDWFLFNKPNGPFFALNLRDKGKNPELTVMKIAYRCLEGLYPKRQDNAGCKVCDSDY